MFTGDKNEDFWGVSSCCEVAYLNQKAGSVVNKQECRGGCRVHATNGGLGIFECVFQFFGNSV